MPIDREKLFGNYIGYVLEDVDPLQSGRVQVFIPSVHSQLQEVIETPEILTGQGGSMELPMNMSRDQIESLKEFCPWATLAQPMIGGGSGHDYSGGSMYGGDGNPSGGVFGGYVTIDKFSFNSDGAGGGGLSSTYQSKTASGISNTGEILGYTIPLDSTFTKVKDGRIRQPAIITFQEGGNYYRILAIANDTGGIHINGDSKNRGWGEIGYNTYKYLQDQYDFPLEIGRNSLTMPQDAKATYELLDGDIRNVEQYRALKEKLVSENRLGTCLLYTSPSPRDA